MILKGWYFLKKLLYIAASPKPETESTSKQVARTFIHNLTVDPNLFEVDELDLYTTDLPQPGYKLFDKHNRLVSGEALESLNEQDWADAQRMEQLCSQFLAADFYIISAPMWGLSFPSKLKQYFDCIFLLDRLFSIDKHGFHGLLGDKDRSMVYIQSSGGIYPKILCGQINYAIRYCRDVFRHLGIACFEPLFIQGTDMPNVGQCKALEKAAEDMEDLLKHFQKKLQKQAIYR